MNSDAVTIVFADDSNGNKSLGTPGFLPDGGGETRQEVETLTARLAMELADTKLLQRVSASLIHEENIETVYEILIGAACTIMHADFASLQMFYPEHGPTGEL